MADDSGLEGKSSRPVRKSKQIAEDMRLAMMMASQLSKQIDKAEKVGHIRWDAAFNYRFDDAPLGRSI